MNNEQINNEVLELQRVQSLKVSEMDLSLIENHEFGGIDPQDYPEFCDAYIAAAEYNGCPLSEEQIDELNENSQYVYDQVIDYVINTRSY